MQTLYTLVDGSVNSALLQTVLDVNQLLLEFFSAVVPCVIHIIHTVV